MSPSGHGIKALSLGETEREVVGMIATAREQTTGALWTLHRGGKPTAALRAIIEALERDEGDWRIVSVATPPTIYRDMQGIREAVDQQGRKGDWDPRQAEIYYLRSIGRLDMLERRRFRTVYGEGRFREDPA